MTPEEILPSPFDRLAPGEARPFFLAADEVLFHKGTTPHAIFYVVSGSVRLQRQTDFEEMVILHRAKAGELIAENSLFTPSYSCECVAEDDSRLVALSKSAVLQRIGGQP